MSRWTFNCETHEEYGTHGWRLTNMPAFDPLPGMAVAHDVMEHWPNDDSTTGELMALGAMMHVRGEDYFGYKGKIHTAPSYHFNSELAELMLKIKFGEWVSLKKYPHKSVTTGLWIDDEIKEGIDLAARYIIEDRGEEPNMPSEEEWHNVFCWMAHGYNKAQKRYHHINRTVLLDTFMEIEDKADEELTYATPGITQLIVSLTWKSGMITDTRSPLLNVRAKEVYV